MGGGWALRVDSQRARMRKGVRGSLGRFAWTFGTRLGACWFMIEVDDVAVVIVGGAGVGAVAQQSLLKSSVFLNRRAERIKSRK